MTPFIGKLFCDTYLLIEQNRWGYIIIKANNDKIPKLNLTNKDLLKKIKVHNIDDIPHVVLCCRPRFIKSILRVSNDSMRIYNLLKFYFTDDDIKTYWYDLWLINHNEVTRKRNIAEMSQLNKLRKEGKLSIVDKEILNITQHSTIRNSAKWSLT